MLWVRYQLDARGWEEPLARLEGLALVGPEGAGKTTLLEDLGERLARRGTARRARPPGW